MNTSKKKRCDDIFLPSVITSTAQENILVVAKGEDTKPMASGSIFCNGLHSPYLYSTRQHLHMVADFPSSCNCGTSPSHLCIQTMTNEWLHQVLCLQMASKM